jgi:hypothetical protein
VLLRGHGSEPLALVRSPEAIRYEAECDPDRNWRSRTSTYKQTGHHDRLRGVWIYRSAKLYGKCKQMNYNRSSPRYSLIVLATLLALLSPR